MAKGVSGALTRLAKITVPSPVRNGSALDRGSPRQRPSLDEDDEPFYLSEDLDDFSDRLYVKRRTDASQERPAPVAAAPALAGASPAPAGVAAAGGLGVAPAAARAPVYAEPLRSTARPGCRPAVRVESWDEADEYEDVVDDGIPVGRGGGRIAERIRRLRTSLAARTGREPEPEEPVRPRAAAKPAGRIRTLDEDEADADQERGIRHSCRPKQVARVRRRLGMTQAEFARCFGIATEDVVRWEAGAKPTRAERVLLTLIMHDPEEMARLVDEALALK